MEVTNKKRNFLVVGGDARMESCMELLSEYGFNVYSFGMEENEKTEDFIEYIKGADYILLPYPASKDSININTPKISKKIPLEILGKYKKEQTKIFGGISDEGIFENQKSLNFINYSKNEDYLFKNAMITAEGALNIIISQSKKSIFDSKILIAGYGRIGKILSELLYKMRAEVYISLRNKKDIAYIKNRGYTYLKYDDVEKRIGEFDIIINTVPHIIFSKKAVLNMKKDAFYIDLASNPGGCEFSDMKAQNINFIHALALPGKISPYSSGKIIFQTVLAMLNEE